MCTRIEGISKYFETNKKWTLTGALVKIGANGADGVTQIFFQKHVM